MDSIINIVINWQWLLGIFGTLLMLSWLFASQMKNLKKNQEHFEKILKDVVSRLGSIEGYLRDQRNTK